MHTLKIVKLAHAYASEIDLRVLFDPPQGMRSTFNFIKDKEKLILIPLLSPKDGSRGCFHGPNCAIIYVRLPTGQI